MNTVTHLSTQAIQASQNGQWQEGIRLNTEILDQETSNVPALNRLAFCHMQLGNHDEAKKIYENVLTIERHNSIAGKYLSLLQQKVQIRPAPMANNHDFIEEPGKTKSVSLQKLADPEVLQATPTAAECKLVLKNHRVNVVTETGSYIGSLPDDIAFRLHKLIQSGNQYRVLVQSTSKKHCTVFIKESFKSPECAFATSFPLSQGNRAAIVTDEILIDDTAVDTSETGEEAEPDITTDDFAEATE